MSKAALAHLNKDAILYSWIEKIGPLKHAPLKQEPFPSLTRAIVYQQLSGKAAGTIFGRFKMLYGSENDFPTAKQVIKTSTEKLRSVGLSRQKISYIMDLAKRVEADLIPTFDECKKLTDAELLENLTQIKGIGRWTVEMFLMFNLGRPDVLPVHDLGIRKGYQRAFKKREMPEPKKLEKLGLPWAPYRTTAARYLWRIADFEKKKV